MQRDIAPEEFKWNLNDIYSNMDQFYEDLKKLEQNYKKFADFKGKLGNFDDIFNYFSFSDKFNALFEKVYSYIFLHHDIDISNTLYLELLERINLLVSNLSLETAYIGPELANLSNEFYQSLLCNEIFKDYEYKIKNILDSRKYILSEKEETALATTSKFSNGFDEIYEALTQADFKFEPVIVNSKKEILTQSTYAKFIESSDRNVRTQAYNNLYSVFNQFSKTISYNYINFVKMITSEIELRKAGSVFNYHFYTKRIPEDIFTVLNNNVDKNLHLEHKYFKLLKKVLNLQDFGFQDVYQTLSADYENKWNIDDQKEIVLHALAPLGSEYLEILKSAYKNNWIDFFANENKKSGGYMLGVYGIHPYILLNDTGGYDSLSTLAHELGHAVHTHFSTLAQPYAKHDYATFIAEIASTVNEILLVKFMIKHANNYNEKLFYISHYLQAFKSTVFRQTMFGEFEHYAYKKAENNEILSQEILDSKYKSLLQKHFGDIVKIDSNIIHEWLRIPHFYSPYYVFQYSTSYICAVYIANSILNKDKNMLENYMKILSSGSNGYPLEILKNSGIDLLNNDIYDYAFADMKDCLDTAESLLNLKN